MKIVIVTGGSGYIGSAVCMKLLNKGYKVINLDLNYSLNLNNNNFVTYHVDLTDPIQIQELIPKLRSESRGDTYVGLIHMAAWKDLTESFESPYEYYRNNVCSFLGTIELMYALNIGKYIFSSTAAVYDDDCSGAILETDETTASSPYAYSKLCVERMMRDIADNGHQMFALRYQNPIGCIQGVTQDLSDSIFGNVVKSIRDNITFTIYGGTYPTKDGTCIRDYIDINDIADIHVHFLNQSPKGLRPNFDIVNVGIGEGTSVLDVCKMIKSKCPQFEYQYGKARYGDAAGSYADVSKLKNIYQYNTFTSLQDTVNNLLDLAYDLLNPRIKDE